MATSPHLSPSAAPTAPFGSFPPDFPDASLLNLTGQLEEIDSIPFSGGGYADVYKYRAGPNFLGEDNGSGLYAVKAPRFVHGDRRGAAAKLAREVVLWNRLQHENILKLHGILFRRSNQIPCLVSEYMENGTSDEFLKNNADADLIQVIRDAAKGLSHLHEKDIAHGDIKPNNILVGGEGRARVADFGLSRTLGCDGLPTEVTTTDGNRCNRWHAVEYLDFASSAPHPVGPTKPGDVWSFGCTVLQLFSGKLPFYDAVEVEIGLRLSRKELPKFPPDVMRPEFKRYRAAIVAFCHLCWVKNPNFRPQMCALEDLVCSDYWDAISDTSEMEDERPRDAVPTQRQLQSPTQTPGSASDPADAVPADGARLRSASASTLVETPPTDERELPHDYSRFSNLKVEPQEEPLPTTSPQGGPESPPSTIPSPPPSSPPTTFPDPLPVSPPQPPLPFPPSLKDMLESRGISPIEILNQSSMSARRRFSIKYEDDGSSGPPGFRTYSTRCLINGEEYGTARCPGKKRLSKEGAALLSLKRLYLEDPALFADLRYHPVLSRYLEENGLVARVVWNHMTGPSPGDPANSEHRVTFTFDGYEIATGVGSTQGIAAEHAARMVQVAWSGAAASAA